MDGESSLREIILRLLAPVLIMIGAVIVCAILVYATVGWAKEWGQEAGKYAWAMEADWYRSLKMPDHPEVPCCGAGDAYYADDSEMGPHGELYAIITDTRPNIFKLDDGTEATRPPVAVGTKALIPPEKIRKHPIPNPTDHTVVFMGNETNVYCYEPVAGN